MIEVNNLKKQFIKEEKNKKKVSFYAVDDISFKANYNEIVGVIRIRHKNSKHFGHIGYDIAPEYRNLGYGSKILELGIIEAKKLGFDTVVLTCLDYNIASQKVIKKNGGFITNIFENTNFVWISTMIDANIAWRINKANSSTKYYFGSMHKIFSTEEKAKEFIKITRDLYGGTFNIEPYELDAPMPTYKEYLFFPIFAL